MTEATRSGWLSARSRLIAPPSEWPTRCALAMPMAAMKSHTAAVSAPTSPVADLLGRAAMAGQVDGVGRVRLGQGRLVEQPVVQVAAEAVDEEDRRAARHRRASGSAGGGRRPRRTRARAPLCGRLGRRGGEARLELGDEGLDRRRPAIEASATTARSAPTGTVSPSPTSRRRSGPATGLSKALAIFEVSMSAISWPLVTSCPSATCHAASMPSCIARPHLGMTMGWISAISDPSP